MKEFTEDLSEKQNENEFALGTGEGESTPSPYPPCGVDDGSYAYEPPLSNRLISVRANQKRASKKTGGSIEVYPSMLVRKRDRSPEEQEYYDMLARFGKQGKLTATTRGKIDHFSNASRFRMLKRLGSISREDPPFMVTLTYRSGSVTFQQAKKDLQKWRKRMDREFGIRHETKEPYIRKDGLPATRKRYKYEPKWSGSWRFEVTTGRGKRAKGATPHFHILVWCEDWYEMNDQELDHILSEMWCEVTGDGGPDRMKYGCRIDQSGGDQTKIKNYMLGHHGKKTDQEATGAGRHWGFLNKELLQLGKPTQTVTLTPEQRIELDRLTARLIASRRGTETQDLTDLKETHCVLGPYDRQRIFRHLGVGNEDNKRQQIPTNGNKFQHLPKAQTLSA